MEMKDLFKEHAEAVEERLEKLVGKDEFAEIKARLDDVEQKQARRPGAEAEAGESWGAQLASHMAELEEVGRASSQSRRAAFRLELKTTITTDGASGGPLTRPAYRDDVVGLPRRRLRVRDLLPVVNISTGSVEFPRQTARTNNAAPVAEGATKPESAYAFEMETENAKVIAHWIPASRQVLSDAPQLRDLVDGELLYGLQLKEDAQLLSGDGAGENLNGLITNATAFSAPIDPAGTETMIDMVALAILQAALADYVPDGIVVHPSDWTRMRLLKNVDGDYLLGDPRSSGPTVLWDLPVVSTTSMTVDKVLVGDFRAAATIYDLWKPEIAVATEHADFFVKNLLVIRAEQRLALGIKQPGALIFGDFGNIT